MSDGCQNYDKGQIPPRRTEARASGSSSATCSLPASSVETLLERWEAEQRDWEYSEEMWRKQLGDEYTAIRFNNCRVRAQMLKRVIEDLRAEMVATNKRQPGENAKLTPLPPEGRVERKES